MSTTHVPETDALLLADLVDRALAEQWTDDGELLALLRRAESGDPDQVQLAFKRIEDHPRLELMAWAPDDECLAVALSALQPAAAGAEPDAGTVRVTVAVDDLGGATIIRHAGGSVEQTPTAFGPVADMLREAFLGLRIG